ncbi:hypothetical protein BDY21DRAFT_311131 [Lineolata rhizophorae]|uniref:Annexin n=1 Tax=Lineolata rhizophorae TaxID=578093 RepID=A0A6A6NMZ9_9PEZI|nr:hypothetical protein BDY21DRAFT_311131 [Lineolata rhizophorae]
MLEAYHGTYQSISPLPSPLALPDDMLDDDLPPLDMPGSFGDGGGGGGAEARERVRFPGGAGLGAGLLSPTTPASAGGGGGARRKEKRAKIYDATEDALAIVDALSGRHVDPEPLVGILPQLSHDQLMELRAEYKRVCKVQGRGINVAKHIKMKCSAGSNFGKIAYVTALGRWESEAYWANFWYQSNGARRELLIESLMGRSNAEIREIKDAFRDKRYGDSLSRCMDKELRADKFRTAVLLALEERRQEETDRLPVEYRNRDVDILYQSLHGRDRSESTMLGVVVTRSDAHLREVLRTYERKYQENFARAALKRSNNLVGEVIAHILNGVINRPARDALLMRHALSDLLDDPPSNPRSSSVAVRPSSSRQDRRQRHELLISRLVRLHWDRPHWARVKAEYRDRYGAHVEDDIEDATRGDFREFCLSLCEAGR